MNQKNPLQKKSPIKKQAPWVRCGGFTGGVRGLRDFLIQLFNYLNNSTKKANGNEFFIKNKKKHRDMDK